jgi:hypothetical protein
MSGPANEIVGEQAKLFRRLQAFENSILIRTQVQYLRFLVEMVRTGAVTPGPLSLPTLFFLHRWVDLPYELKLPAQSL